MLKQVIAAQWFRRPDKRSLSVICCEALSLCHWHKASWGSVIWMPLPSVLPPGATTPCLVLTSVYFAVEFFIKNNAKEFWSAWTGVSLSLWHIMLLNSLFKALIPTDIINAQLSRERGTSEEVWSIPELVGQSGWWRCCDTREQMQHPCACTPSVWVLPRSLPCIVHLGGLPLQPVWVSLQSCFVPVRGCEVPVPQPGAVASGSSPVTLPRICAGTLGHFNFSLAVYAFKHCKLLRGWLSLKSGIFIVLLQDENDWEKLILTCKPESFKGKCKVTVVKQISSHCYKSLCPRMKAAFTYHQS